MARHEKATTRQNFDPSGSIFLPETIETAEDRVRIRQQIIFGRGIYRSARLSVESIEILLRELDREAS